MMPPPTNRNLSNAKVMRGTHTRPSAKRSVTDEPGRKPQKLKRIRRSRTGCKTCKARKVKCDENRETCRNCARLSLACEWDSNVHPRASGSHSRSPSTTHSCSIATKSPEQAFHPSPAVSLDTVRHQLGTSHDVDLLITAYFEHVHPLQANAFLHRGDLQRDIREGVASPIVVKVVCAVAARYLDNSDPNHPDGGAIPGQWIQDVKNALMCETDRIGIPRLIATLCLVGHEFASGRMASAWIFCSLAVRYAMAMGLNLDYMNDGLPWGEKELRKRLMWSAFAADCMCCGGVPEYVTCPASAIRLGLPSAEYNYGLSIPVYKEQKLNEIQDPGSPSPGENEDGLMARFVRLMALRAEIVTYVKTISTFPGKPWDPDSRFNVLLERCRHWRNTLPSQLLLSTDNLYARHGTHELGAFFLLHMWHDQIHCSLYRLALPGFEESAPAQVLQGAPAGWINNLREAVYVRATALRQKCALLQKHFPNHVPNSWQFALLAWEMIRNTLQYLAVKYPQGLPPDQQQVEQEGFENAIQLISKMAKYFSSTKMKIRDLTRILARHGFSVDTAVWESNVPSSGARTPARGPVLSRLPAFRRHLAHPQIDGTIRRRPDEVTSMMDPMDQTSHLVASSMTEPDPSSIGTSTGMRMGMAGHTQQPSVVSPADYLAWLPSLATTNDTSQQGPTLAEEFWNPFDTSEFPRFDYHIVNNSMWLAEEPNDLDHFEQGHGQGQQMPMQPPLGHDMVDGVSSSPTTAARVNAWSAV